MAVYGNPLTVRTTVRDKAVAHLLANNGDGYYTGLVGLAHDPPDITAIRNSLPCLTVDFWFPEPAEFEESGGTATIHDYLQLTYYQRITVGDLYGELATNAVEDAIWRLQSLLSANKSLWMTVDKSSLYRKRIEQLAVELTKPSGVNAKFGWLTLKVDYRVLQTLT